MSKRNAPLSTIALALFGLVLLAGVPGAWAQAQQPSPPQAEPARTPLPAPVGHRQPRAADVPTTEGRDVAPAPGSQRANRPYDSHLQICRNC